MTDTTAPLDDAGREYSLDELSKIADVSPRTVRYYIVEGLLPPPLTSGRNATYSQEHLDRLRAISVLKEMFLPLKEIRYRLNSLTREQMRDPEFLTSLSQAAANERAFEHMRHARARRGMAMHEDSAAGYLDRLERPGPDRGRGHGRRPAPQAMSDAPMRRAVMSAPLEDEPEIRPSLQSWERFPLGDDAEIMIRSSKVQNMGPRLYRMLHRLRHMIDNEDQDPERNR